MNSCKNFLIILGVPLVTIALSGNRNPGIVQNRGIVLSYKGNMGVLVSFQKCAVLIDGLHEYYGPQYLQTPTAEITKIFSGKNPYANLNIALFTHHHKDHYSVKLARDFLATSKNHLVVGSSQVIDSLAALSTINAWNRNDIIFRDSSNNFSIYSYNISHTGPLRHSKVQNIGYVVKSGQTAILHIGDADIDPKNFKHFSSQAITVLIAPVWFLTDSKGVQIISEIIKPKVVIATHISPTESNSLDQYKISGISTHFFRVINQAVRI